MNRVVFSSASVHWGTPVAVYEALDSEFHFTMDACPLGDEIAGLKSWAGERVYCNPPYGPGIDTWLRRAREAALAVYLIPSRTDTRWWHRYVMRADEIRFLRGRLKFGDAAHNAPFPSAVVIFGTPPPPPT